MISLPSTPTKDDDGLSLKMCDAISVFRGFGGFGGFRFNFGDEEEEEVVRKGDDVFMMLEISLRDAFVGKDIEV